MVGESSIKIGGDDESWRTGPGILVGNELIPPPPVAANGLKTIGATASSGVEADEAVVVVVVGVGLSDSVTGIALFTAS